MSDNNNIDSTLQRPFGIRKNNNVTSIGKLSNETRQSSVLKSLKSAPTDQSTKKSLRSTPSAPEPRGLSAKSNNNSNNKTNQSFKGTKSTIYSKSTTDESTLSKASIKTTEELSISELEYEVSELEEALKKIIESVKEYNKLYESRDKELISIRQDIDSIKHLQKESDSLASPSEADDNAEVTQSELIAMRDELLAQVKIDSDRLESAIKNFESRRRLQEAAVLETEKQVKEKASSRTLSLSPTNSVKVDEHYQDLLYVAECEYEAARARNQELHQLLTNFSQEA